MKNSDRPANPIAECIIDNAGDHEGLTKREHFAAMAMQGLLTCTMDTDCSIKELCADSVAAADYLLAELEK